MTKKTKSRKELKYDTIKKMNIGILALDSIYSNPALMKISNYHKRLGYNMVFIVKGIRREVVC